MRSKVAGAHVTTDKIGAWISAEDVPVTQSPSYPVIDMSTWFLRELGKEKWLSVVLTTSPSGVPRGQRRYGY